MFSFLKRAKFYRDGIRFECQQCGKCCRARGDYGHVFISPGDRFRMAASLHVSTREFHNAYAETTQGRLHLRDPHKDCIFLQNNNCSMYDIRPRQCRTWPFWPENMKKFVWETQVAPFCPSVGKGKLYSAQEIEGILRQDKEIRPVDIGNTM